MEWPYQYTPYIWPITTAIGLSAVVGICSWRHRSIPGAVGFAFMMFLGVLKLMTSTLWLPAREFLTKVFWFQIERLALLPAAVTSPAFALGYAGLDTWLDCRTFTLPAISALLLIPLFFKNDAHNLTWTHIWLYGRMRYAPVVLACDRKG